MRIFKNESNIFKIVISENDPKLDPKEIQAIAEFSVLRNAENVKQFLGLAGSYR